MRQALAGLAALTIGGAAHAEPVGKTAWDVGVVQGAFDSPACRARIKGPDLNSTILENNAGRPVLLLARSDWEAFGGRMEITLSVDGGPAQKMDGRPLGPIVAVGIVDPGMEESLGRARQIEWTLPIGRFRGDIAGFGEAWAALKTCNTMPVKPKARD